MNCPSCGTATQPGIMFCPMCGQKLADLDVASIGPEMPSLAPPSIAPGPMPSQIGGPMQSQVPPPMPSQVPGQGQWMGAQTVIRPEQNSQFSLSPSLQGMRQEAASRYAGCPHCHNPVGQDAGYCFVCCNTIPVEIELPDFGSDFEPLFPLGQGGMGKIYVVRDQAGREVVLKTMLDPAMVDRFRREAVSIARLNHPNIVTMFIFRPDPPGPYLVMEFCKEGTLRHLMMRSGGVVDENWFFKNMPPLLEALGHAQAQGMVHRDISPENIFFQDGSPKLGDFGLASDHQQVQLTATGAFMGKLHYAAPEQWEDAAHVDIRADLFGLGMTMYYALTGKQPFPAIELDRVPAACRHVIKALTQQDPENRPDGPLEASLLLSDRYSRLASRAPIARRVPGKSTSRINPNAGMVCFECGFDVADTTPETPFCPSCGATQFRECPGCNNNGRVGLAFCRHCGLDIQTLLGHRSRLDDVVATVERGSLRDARLHISEMLEERPAASGARGTTELLGSVFTDAERWADLLDELWKDAWDSNRAAGLSRQLSVSYPQVEMLQEIVREGDRIAAKPTEARRIDGFTHVGNETFTCHNDVESMSFDVDVYRCDAMVKALGLVDVGRQPDLEFVLLPIGRKVFTIGSPTDEEGRLPFQEKQSEVKFERDFLIARTSISRRVYLACSPGARRAGRSAGDEGLMPSTGMTWNEASRWCDPLGLRLPTEAEWEYAARAGTETPFCFGSTILPTMANYEGKHPYGKAPATASLGRPVPVGSLPNNAFGLYEVHGNVWEWTADLFRSEGAGSGEAERETDGERLRVLRGGSFRSHAKMCRSAHRRRRGEDTFASGACGFRPTRTVT